MTEPGKPTESPKTFTLPAAGEAITSLATGNTYTISNRIGEGAYGIVFECRDVWHNELAVKILKPTSTYEAVRAAAEAEFGKLLHLRRPFITYIYDAFEYRDTFYIVTERCHCTVTELFRVDGFDGPLWLMAIARCLLQAGHYLHQNNYVHRDIHPGNVFTSIVRHELMPTEPGSILFKLGDLGISRVVEEVAPDNTWAPWMVPPEVLHPTEFGPTDRRVDIYHMGLLFLQLAKSADLRFTKTEILAGRPREMAAELEPPLNVALEKALRPHVAARTETAMELWRDLQSSMPTESSTATPPAASPGAA